MSETLEALVGLVLCVVVGILCLAAAVLVVAVVLALFAAPFAGVMIGVLAPLQWFGLI